MARSPASTPDAAPQGADSQTDPATATAGDDTVAGGGGSDAVADGPKPFLVGGRPFPVDSAIGAAKASLAAGFPVPHQLLEAFEAAGIPAPQAQTEKDA